MNKFLVLILFIALIYSVYSYRHDIMRGGLVAASKFNNKIGKDIYNDVDELHTDRYKLYMNQIAFSKLGEFVQKHKWTDIIKTKREITGNAEEKNFYTVLTGEDYPELKDKQHYINLGKLLNSDKLEKYSIRLDIASRWKFYANTRKFLVNISEILSYNYDEKEFFSAQENNITDVYATIREKTSDIGCIPYYIDNDKVYALDLWQLTTQEEMNKTVNEYLNYYKNGKDGEFVFTEFRSPGLFIDSNKDTMGKRKDERKVGPTQTIIEKIKKGIKPTK